MELDNETKNTVKELQMSILDEIHQICQKYDIGYSLIGGTLLGAIRHHGFIPWDDDMDIGMLRSEYEKFIIAAKNELPSSLFLQSFETENEYPSAFAKIRMNKTKWVESLSSHLKIHQGIYIDIFPYDVTPVSTIKQRYQKYLLLLFKRLIAAKQDQYRFNQNRPFKILFYLSFKMITWLFTINQLVKCQNSIMKLFDNEISNNVTNMGGGYTYEKQTMPKSIFYKLKEAKFENRIYMIFAEPEIYLSHLMGNYMILPPEKDRENRHNISYYEIDDSILTKLKNYDHKTQK
jgi:lipopolysaccharide cholinephosphotransferase